MDKASKNCETVISVPIKLQIYGLHNADIHKSD